MNKYQQNIFLVLIFLFSFGLRVWLTGVNFINILGSLTPVVFYYLINILTKNKKISIFSALSLTFLPWPIHISRGSVRSVIIIFLIITALFFLVKLIQAGTLNQKLLVPSALVIILLSNIYLFDLNYLSPVYLVDQNNIGYFGLIMSLFGLFKYSQRQINLADKIFLYWLIAAPGKTIIIPLSFFIGYGLKNFSAIKLNWQRYTAYFLTSCLFAFQLICYFDLYYYH